MCNISVVFHNHTGGLFMMSFTRAVSYTLSHVFRANCTLTGLLWDQGFPLRSSVDYNLCEFLLALGRERY